MTTGVLLGTNGEARAIELGTTDQEHLETMKGIVGGYVECVTLPTLPVVTLWCNEDGHRLQLPANQLAAGLVHGVLGNVVLAGGATDDGTLMSIPQEWLNILEAVHA